MVAAGRWLQFTPSYSHVWLLAPISSVLGTPPNATVRPRALSNAMPWRPVRNGVVAVTRCVHVVPFHSHVSWNDAPPTSETLVPPNNTHTPRFWS